MNRHKICFITCVNHKQQYNESLYYINQLEIPKGYEIECICVENANSITQGYNKAMNSTDAKYKVYLHQDVLITNTSFIENILEILNNDDRIGMLGVIGSKIIPTNAIWWESNEKYGKVYDSHTGDMQLLDFKEVTDKYQRVQGIDGLVMITQHDLPWREDIFDGWHFYDISQSIEFQKNNYIVAIPKQDTPWCIHECGVVNVNNGYEKYRNIFLKEYSKDIFPLVSILIPTYNKPQYLKSALESVINQTYQNTEIIVFDDSTNNHTEKLINNNYLHKYPNIRYYHNDTKKGKLENERKLFDMSNGKYINYMMDDDIFEIDKIEKMMKYYIFDEEDNISVVTSHSGLINEDGSKKNILGGTNKGFETDIVLQGLELGNYTLINNYKFIGGLTPFLFNKTKLCESFGVFNEKKYDITQALWLNLLLTDNVVYINEILCYYRYYENENQDDIIMNLTNYIECLYFILTYQEKNMVSTNDYLRSTGSCLKFCQDNNLVLNNKSTGTNEYQKFIKSYNKLNDKYNKINIGMIEKKLCGRTKDEKEKIKNSFEYNYHNNLFVKKDYTPIDYSDGSEKYIIDVFNKIRNIDNDNTNDNIEKYIKDWPSKYHLSKIRTNLFESIRPIIENKKNVLELGGGMGAVTQWLGDNCEYVDVIEGSLNRAKANRLRNKYNDHNLQIFVDDLLSMTFPKKRYDLATLIGVLEYIPYYDTDKKPEQACISFLNRVCNHLDDDGLLVIAIENKLGAKYFSGCVEDHNAQLFSGIHGYPNHSPITFSRIEMKNILSSAGFKNIQFYHCFPDYKLPKVILQESEKIYNLNVGSIARNLFDDYANARRYLICDPLFIDTLTKARLLHEFSNSFLIVCSKSEAVDLRTENVGIKFWNDDGVKNCYHHKTYFTERGGRAYVERKPFYGGKNKVEQSNLTYELNNETMLDGEILSLEAYRSILKKDKYISLIKLTKEVRRFVIKEFWTNKLDDEGYRLLDGKSIDCCFNNIIRCNERLNFIDRKWKLKSSISEDYLIFRNLLGLYSEMHPFISEDSLENFIMIIMNNIYEDYGKERLKINLQKEVQFRNYILQ